MRTFCIRSIPGRGPDKPKPAASMIKILVSLAHRHWSITVLHLWIVANLQWLFSEISLVGLVYSDLPLD